MVYGEEKHKKRYDWILQTIRGPFRKPTGDRSANLPGAAPQPYRGTVPQTTGGCRVGGVEYGEEKNVADSFIDYCAEKVDSFIDYFAEEVS